MCATHPWFTIKTSSTWRVQLKKLDVITLLYISMKIQIQIYVNRSWLISFRFDNQNQYFIWSNQIDSLSPQECYLTRRYYGFPQPIPYTSLNRKFRQPSCSRSDSRGTSKFRKLFRPVDYNLGYISLDNALLEILRVTSKQSLSIMKIFRFYIRYIIKTEEQDYIKIYARLMSKAFTTPNWFYPMVVHADKDWDEDEKNHQDRELMSVEMALHQCLF